MFLWGSFLKTRILHLFYNFRKTDVVVRFSGAPDLVILEPDHLKDQLMEVGYHYIIIYLVSIRGINTCTYENGDLETILT